MYFPLYVDLTEKNILFAGGGKIAARRVHILMRFAKHITVVAPRFEESFGELEEESQIRLVQRTFDFSDLIGRDLVFAATDDTELNRQNDVWRTILSRGSIFDQRGLSQSVCQCTGNTAPAP